MEKGVEVSKRTVIRDIALGCAYVERPVTAWEQGDTAEDSCCCNGFFFTETGEGIGHAHRFSAPARSRHVPFPVRFVAPLLPPRIAVVINQEGGAPNKDQTQLHSGRI